MPNNRRNRNSQTRNQRQRQQQLADATKQHRRSNEDRVPNQTKFTVFIDDGERCQIEKWVEMNEYIETGGDLFGLWVDSHTAVIQFVLGPGQKCRRTTTSFYQDVEYLKNAGNYLTQKHGLCNVGQWHSHHRLGLTRPSGGDENTVWGNMPSLGLKRYIVFIATIKGLGERMEVNINPYLFEIDQRGRRLPVVHGELKVLKGQNSPFRNTAIGDNPYIRNGREAEKEIKRDKIPKGTRKAKKYTSRVKLPPKFPKVEIKFIPVQYCFE